MRAATLSRRFSICHHPREISPSRLVTIEYNPPTNGSARARPAATLGTWEPATACRFARESVKASASAWSRRTTMGNAGSEKTLPTSRGRTRAPPPPNRSPGRPPADRSKAPSPAPQAPAPALRHASEVRTHRESARLNCRNGNEQERRCKVDQVRGRTAGVAARRTRAGCPFDPGRDLTPEPHSEVQRRSRCPL